MMGAGGRRGGGGHKLAFFLYVVNVWPLRVPIIQKPLITNSFIF